MKIEFINEKWKRKFKRRFEKMKWALPMSCNCDQKIMQKTIAKEAKFTYIWAFKLQNEIFLNCDVRSIN